MNNSTQLTERLDPVDILIVDDNAGKLIAMESALAPLGQNLIKATSGRDALQHLLSRDFAVVILDVNMPDMDGFETARMIRSRARSSRTPIVFVSAINIDEIDAHKGYSLGAVDYIFAPIVPEVLRAKVSVFVDLHRKTAEANAHAKRLEERTLQLERSQRELRLAERMAMVGTLCAGLGHDMGNLLMPILVWLDVMKLDELPDDAREGFESIRSCARYLQRLSEGLRLLSLDPEREFGESVTVLDDWWCEVGPILRNALPRGLKLEWSCDDDLPSVEIGRHQLAQVVYNLVQNAGEALRERGHGVVRVWIKRPDEKGMVRMGVTDDGPGMPPEVRFRCFDPFFTTKKRSFSTGLGLALVNGIIQKAGGATEIETSASGTTISFTLPAVSAGSTKKPVAIVSLTEPRVRGYALGIIQLAGFDSSEQPPEEDDRAAILITEPTDDLDDRAERFRRDRTNRAVFVYTNSPDQARGHPTFAITGDGVKLHQQLREFLAAHKAPPASKSVRTASALAEQMQ